MMINAQQIPSTPGVWLLAARHGVKIRDGAGFGAPMVTIDRVKPTWLAKRSAAEFFADRDVYVVAGLAPPTEPKKRGE